MERFQIGISIVIIFESTTVYVLDIKYIVDVCVELQIPPTKTQRFTDPQVKIVAIFPLQVVFQLIGILRIPRLVIASLI